MRSSILVTPQTVYLVHALEGKMATRRGKLETQKKSHLGKVQKYVFGGILGCSLLKSRYVLTRRASINFLKNKSASL
jgi:hypothetical protein